jgi:subtilisin family serine protease
MPVRVCYDDGGNGSCYQFTVVYGLYYAVLNGASVVNMSFGGTDSTCGEELNSWNEAMAYAHESGVVMVAAAGSSESDTPFYPACYPDVIGVTIHGGSASYIGGNYGAWVDVAAPGVLCRTTTVGGGYAMQSGTSISSPHAAAIAGLLLSASPGLSPDAVRQIIIDSCVPLDWPDNPIVGGRVNAFNALSSTGVAENPGVGRPAVLHGSYPNPFNPLTTIRYELGRSSEVTLEVFSISGRKVRTLVDSERLAPGLHRATWDGRDRSGRPVASGAYFYRLGVDGEVETRKMILVR